MMENYPADAVPDGAVLAPHHVHIGVLLAVLALALVWDDAANKEPWVGLVALLAVSFAFITIWPFYPVTGATFSMAAVLLALVVPFLQFWRSYPWFGARGVLLIGALVALDDVVEHAIGFPTPLDWFWTEHLVQHIH